MESSSPIHICPSFNTNPFNDISDIADRVVQELRIENGFQNDDVFTFSDDEVTKTNDRTEILNHNKNDDVFTFGNDDVINTEHEFEFPSVSTDDVTSDDQISLQYPVFDQSLLLSETTDLNFSNGNSVNSPETESKPVTSPRSSLRKLFSEDRDDPSTSASSETDNLDGVTPGTYCVWKPKTETERERPRGKHKKSNSVSIGNISKKWKVKDLLKRSYSDDSYSVGKESPVVVFLPPISPKRKTNGEKENKSEVSNKTGKVGNGVTAVKTERNISAYRTKIGNIRVPPYLPYRQGQVAAFGNFTGSSKNLYRY